MSVWKLVIPTATPPINATFASLGLSGLRRTLVSQGVDRVTFTAPATAIDADPLLTYGQQAQITKDGQPWFLGVCTTNPRQGNSAKESITYELQGPWYYLERCMYRQYWLNVYDQTSGALTSAERTRVILNKGTGLTHTSTTSQIYSILSHAIANGAPIAIGTIAGGYDIPWEEVKDMTCADLIIRMLRWMPDAVCWFDYSTEVPIFNCLRTAALLPVNVDITAGAPLAAVDITPRHDLKPDGVEITFESSYTVSRDGTDDPPETFNSVVVQRAGNTSGWNVYRTSMELAGSAAKRIVKVETENWPADLTAGAAKPFIRRWCSALRDLPEADWEVLSATRINQPDGKPSEDTDGLTDTLPRVLSPDCYVPTWATDDDGNEIKAENVVVTLRIRRAQRGKDNEVIGKFDEQTVAFLLVSTDAESREYWHWEVNDKEPIPAGLAASLFAAWSVLQYDGRVTLVEPECSSYGPGSVVNLLGGREEWETMAALVQEVTQDADSGTTTITVGPQRRISPGDLRSFARFGRVRGLAENQRSQGTGLAADRALAQVDGVGLDGKNEQSVVDSGEPKTTAWSQYDGEDDDWDTGDFGSFSGGDDPGGGDPPDPVPLKKRAKAAPNGFQAIKGHEQDDAPHDPESRQDYVPDTTPQGAVLKANGIEAVKNGGEGGTANVKAALTTDQVADADDYMVYQKQTVDGVEKTIFDWVRLHE